MAGPIRPQPSALAQPRPRFSVPPPLRLAAPSHLGLAAPSDHLRLAAPSANSVQLPVRLRMLEQITVTREPVNDSWSPPVKVETPKLPMKSQQQLRPVSAASFAHTKKELLDSPKVKRTPLPKKPFSDLSAEVRTETPIKLEPKEVGTTAGDEKKPATCFNCNLDFQGLSVNFIYRHYCRHFRKRLLEGQTSSLRCRVCDIVLAEEDQLLIHLGLTHGMLHPLLPQKAKIAPSHTVAGHSSMQGVPSEPRKQGDTVSIAADKIKSQASRNISISTPFVALAADIQPVHLDCPDSQGQPVPTKAAVQSTKDTVICFHCAKPIVCDSHRSRRFVLYSHYARHYPHVISTYIGKDLACLLCRRQGSRQLLELHVAIHHNMLDKVIPAEHRVPLPTKSKDARGPQLWCPLCKAVIMHALAKQERRRDYLCQHLIGHYRDELRKFTNGDMCLLCGERQTRRNLLRHVGVVHAKLEELVPPDVAEILGKRKHRKRIKCSTGSIASEEDEDSISAEEEEEITREIKMEVEEHFQDDQSGFVTELELDPLGDDLGIFQSTSAEPDQPDSVSSRSGNPTDSPSAQPMSLKSSPRKKDTWITCHNVKRDGRSSVHLACVGEQVQVKEEPPEPAAESVQQIVDRQGHLDTSSLPPVKCEPVENAWVDLGDPSAMVKKQKSEAVDMPHQPPTVRPGKTPDCDAPLFISNSTPIYAAPAVPFKVELEEIKEETDWSSGLPVPPKIEETGWSSCQMSKVDLPVVKKEADAEKDDQLQTRTFMAEAQRDGEKDIRMTLGGWKVSPQDSVQNLVERRNSSIDGTLAEQKTAGVDAVTSVSGGENFANRTQSSEAVGLNISGSPSGGLKTRLKANLSNPSKLEIRELASTMVSSNSLSTLNPGKKGKSRRPRSPVSARDDARRRLLPRAIESSEMTRDRSYEEVSQDSQTVHSVHPLSESTAITSTSCVDITSAQAPPPQNFVNSLAGGQKSVRITSKKQEVGFQAVSEPTPEFSSPIVITIRKPSSSCNIRTKVVQTAIDVSDIHETASADKVTTIKNISRRMRERHVRDDTEVLTPSPRSVLDKKRHFHNIEAATPPKLCKYPPTQDSGALTQSKRRRPSPGSMRDIDSDGERETEQRSSQPRTIGSRIKLTKLPATTGGEPLPQATAAERSEAPACSPGRPAMRMTLREWRQTSRKGAEYAIERRRTSERCRQEGVTADRSAVQVKTVVEVRKSVQHHRPGTSRAGQRRRRSSNTEKWPRSHRTTKAGIGSEQLGDKSGIVVSRSQHNVQNNRRRQLRQQSTSKVSTSSSTKAEKVCQSKPTSQAILRSPQKRGGRPPICCCSPASADQDAAEQLIRCSGDCNAQYHAPCAGYPLKRAGGGDPPRLWLCGDCFSKQTAGTDGLACTCRAPYDPTREYQSCRTCERLFHPACIQRNSASVSRKILCTECWNRLSEQQRKPF